MQIHPSRAASPVSIYRPGPDGALALVEVKPAGTLETAKCQAEDLRGKPGRPAGAKHKPDPNRFAESENDF